MRRPDGDSSKDLSLISKLLGKNSEVGRSDWLNPTNNTSK